MNTLEYLEILNTRATPDPWICSGDSDINAPRSSCVVLCVSEEGYEWGHGDRDLTVTMRNALPALLKVVRAAERQCKVLDSGHDIGPERDLVDALAELTADTEPPLERQP